MSFKDLREVEDVLYGQAVDVPTLYRIYQQRRPVTDRASANREGGANHQTQIPWLQASIANARKFTHFALVKQEYLLVCDVAKEAIAEWSNGGDREQEDLAHIRIHYASALTRLGSTREAVDLLKDYEHDNRHRWIGRVLRAEIFFQMGQILREEARHTAARAAQLQIAERALGYYRRASKEDPDRIDTAAFTAAALFIIGEPGSPQRSEAAELATNLLKRIAEIEQARGANFEIGQAKAMAELILEDLDAASQSLRRLSEINPPPGISRLADARYSCSRMAEALGKPKSFFDDCFGPLELVVFAGHLPDLPGQPSRFTPDLIEPIRLNIRAELEKRKPRIAVVRAAAGGDLLLIDEMLRRPETEAVHVVLPWSIEEFLETSVRPHDKAANNRFWETMFESAISRATSVRASGQMCEPSDDVSWLYTTDVAVGIALNIARAARLDLAPWVLWDGLPGWGVGGTASFYHFCEDDLKIVPHRVPGLEGACTLRPMPHPQSHWTAPKTRHLEIKSMMFADIVGYSKLHERTIPLFVEKFLGQVSQLAATSRHAPIHINTWGDCIYAVFEKSRDSGLFALELLHMVKENREKWLREGLYFDQQTDEPAKSEKKPLNIRIGLHTGPVFPHQDPVVRRMGFTGAHVSRAARIEPIAGIGQIFASEEFAALAELEEEIARKQAAQYRPEHVSFVCEYAGAKRLAKDYPGLHQIYRVLPTHVFGVEELAMEIHERYAKKARERGDTPKTNPSCAPWHQLSEDLRSANLAQAADIPNKLRDLGYELSPSYGLPPSEIKPTEAEIEVLAIVEHDRWMNDRIKSGWTLAPTRDDQQKHSPLLVPWDQLSHVEKEKDRDAVRNLPALIELAGFKKCAERVELSGSPRVAGELARRSLR